MQVVCQGSVLTGGYIQYQGFSQGVNISKESMISKPQLSHLISDWAKDVQDKCLELWDKAAMIWESYYKHLINER